jgi:hypothetical protein
MDFVRFYQNLVPAFITRVTGWSALAIATRAGSQPRREYSISPHNKCTWLARNKSGFVGISRYTAVHYSVIKQASKGSHNHI